MFHKQKDTCFLKFVQKLFFHEKQGSQGGGGGGYSGFQVTGMIKRIFGGLKFLIPGFFLGSKIWQVFFWVA